MHETRNIIKTFYDTYYILSKTVPRKTKAVGFSNGIGAVEGT